MQGRDEGGGHGGEGPGPGLVLQTSGALARVCRVEVGAHGSERAPPRWWAVLHMDTSLLFLQQAVLLDKI